MVEDNQDETVSIKDQLEENRSHEFQVSDQDQPIEESPLKFHVDQVKTCSVTAEGPGLSHGICNKPCEFRIFTKDAGTGELFLSINGRLKSEVQYNDNEDGTCDVTYWPVIFLKIFQIII
jgi:filamin